MGRGQQRLGQSTICGILGASELTCAVIWDSIGSSMVHERIARVLICAVHRGGVALAFAELELVVAQGSFSCQQRDGMKRCS
jgi:hypothetical protein